MSRLTFKIPFYMEEGSKRANGCLPLMCRLTVDDETKQFSYELNMSLKLWDVKAARATDKSAEAQKVNAAIDRIHVDANRCYRELMQFNGYVTTARPRDACLGLGMKRETLLKFFEQRNEEFIRKAGRSRVQGTYNRYRTMYKHLCRSVPKAYRRDDIPLGEPNLILIDNFRYFLRTGKGYRISTVWDHVVRLRRVTSIARNSGVPPFNPFTRYIDSPESANRDYLTWCKIQTSTETPVKSGTCKLIRDLFIFSISTGLVYADVKALAIDQLQILFNDNLWIITRRHKTNIKSSIRLLDVPKHVIEKYKGLSKDGHVFPVPSSGRCNTILGESGKQRGFKIRLTYRMARHTSAAAVLLSHGVPIETVSRPLGHTNLKTIQVHARTTSQRISSDVEILSHELEKMGEGICDTI